MSTETEAIRASVQSNGRDTIPLKATGFLDMEKVTSGKSDTTQGSGSSKYDAENSHKLWTEDHEEQSRIRRETRASKEKLPKVAEVPDFDLKEHLSSKQKSSKCVIM